MANWIVNNTFVGWIGGEPPVKGIAGETIVEGEVVYRDFTDNGRLKLADCNSAQTSDVVGISLSGVSAGAEMWYAPANSKINAGVGTPVDGETGYLSETAGKIRPQSDLAVPVGSLNQVVMIGTMENFGILLVAPFNTGVNYYAWSMDRASILSTDLDITSQDTALVSFDFNGANGTKVFALGDTNNAVFEYNLTTAWDVRTGSYASISLTVTTQTASPTAVRLGDSGTKLYVSGGTTIYQYTLTTAYTLTGGSYASKSYDTTVQTTAVTSFFLSSDGSKLFVVDSDGPSSAVFQYTLSTPWDISTASYASKTVSVSAQESTPTGLWFKPDGYLFYVCGTGSNAVYTYRMTTAWDVSTGSYISGGDTKSLTNPQDIALSREGDRMYNANGTDDDIEQYAVTND